MVIPLSYVARNLWVRKLTTALTAGGMALVVFVFSAVLMLDAGLKSALGGTGADDNALFIRKGAQSEVQSGITRAEAALIESMPQIARGNDGQPLASREVLVLNSLTKTSTGKRSNVPVRGLGEIGLRLRPQVTLAQGRMFRPGSTEIVVGSAVVRQFDGVGLGQTLRFAQRQWVVVGILDAGQSAYASEIWGDSEQLLQAFRRTSFSSLVVQLQQPGEIAQVEAQIAADPRLTVEVRPERQFYEDQGRDLSRFITIIGNTLSVIFSLGAIIGAAITMYASVATRTGEIGTLRALGFRRSAILSAFLLEALLLSLVGAAVGLLAASFLQVTTISTTNFNSFSELAFSFRLTPGIVLAGTLFALLMGLVGGVLPAIKASRMKIVDALRAD